MQNVKIRKPDGTIGQFDFLNVMLMDNFFNRFKGLMFSKQINRNQGALFINKNENILDSAIHMLFMNFNIAVFWMDNSNSVVDKKIAKKWNLLYYPSSKASKILETHLDNLDEIQIGEHLIIESN